MTRARYYFAALLKSFGLARNTKRLTDIAFEMHLLQDGEEILGAACWSAAEEIEELSMEYWTIRRLEREQATIQSKVEAAEETLVSANQKRINFVDDTADEGESLVKQREKVFEEIEDLNSQREDVISGAQMIRRKYDALKMKANVLMEEGNGSGEKITECRNALEELKKAFAESKKQTAELDSQITSKEAELTTLQNQIDEMRKGSKGKAQENFGLISQANKDITKYQAELGLLQEDHSQLCRDIGRFLSLNDSRPDCRQACQSKKLLLAQLRLIRRSIQWNRKLVDQAT